jgi:hypothetical protein
MSAMVMSRECQSVAAGNPRTRKSVLRRLARPPRWEVRSWLAQRGFNCLEAEEALAEDDHVCARERPAVSTRKGEILWKLSQDNLIARQKAVCSRHAPAGLPAVLAEDSDKTVRRAALWRPRARRAEGGEAEGGFCLWGGRFRRAEGAVPILQKRGNFAGLARRRDHFIRWSFARDSEPPEDAPVWLAENPEPMPDAHQEALRALGSRSLRDIQRRRAQRRRHRQQSPAGARKGGGQAPASPRGCQSLRGG